MDHGVSQYHPTGSDATGAVLGRIAVVFNAGIPGAMMGNTPKPQKKTLGSCVLPDD